MKDFFISYNKADRSSAQWLAQQLQDAGYTTLLQAENMPPGSNFAHEMQQAIVNTRQTIAVLSPDYLASDFCKSEWYAAFAQDPVGKQRKLIPVRVRPCQPGGLLAQIVYIDLVGKEGAAASQALLDGLAGKVERVAFSVDAHWARYEEQLAKQVSTVRLFGEAGQRELDQVFVELSINEEYERRPNQAEFLGLMDSELRRMRSVFGDAEQHDQDPNDPTQRHLNKTKRTLKPDELLCRHTHAVITGAPGCGKTTLLRYLAWQTLKQWQASGAPAFRVPPCILKLRQGTC
jgi:hypothetical protein